MYTGITSHLLNRVRQHRDEDFDGFSKDNGCKLLVWYEQHGTMETAILREKQIKKWNRQWKVNLIIEANPHWLDLAVGFGFPVLTSTAIEKASAGDGSPPSRG